MGYSSTIFVCVVWPGQTESANHLPTINSSFPNDDDNAYCTLNLIEFPEKIATQPLCIFNRHDILEGIGSKDVRLVLQSLVADKLLTLEELNDRILTFNFG